MVQQLVYIDCTLSNAKQGQRSFGGKSLHYPYVADAPPAYDCAAEALNPYEFVLTAVSRPLQKYDIDNRIPAYLFGDERTRDVSVSPLFDDAAGCNGLAGVLAAYRAALPRTQLYGPTSFAPAIWSAIQWAKRTGEFHIVMILTDGCVSDGEPRRETEAAIVEASHHPIAIVVFGVGDGDSPRDANPWRLMSEFDDALPARAFDNLQFVPVERTRQQCLRARVPDAAFAVHALMEVPAQWSHIRTRILPSYRRDPRFVHPRLAAAAARGV